MRPFACLFVISTLALTACEQQPAGEPVMRAELGEAVATEEGLTAPEMTSEKVPVNPNSACQPARFEGVSLTHCIADPERHTIRVDLAPSSGDNFGTIEGWAAGKNEGAIAFVMNGGPYDDALRPLGYFVRDKDRLKELNREDGSGNFFLKPNGVFFGSSGRWRILDTDTFLRTVGTRPQFGTQSGPMLVVNGALHPEIAEDGASQALRNGVGVTSDGKAHFVISNEPLSFGKLARFFRDELEVRNALFLDGKVSSLWDPSTGRMDRSRVGPLIIVETK